MYHLNKYFIFKGNSKKIALTAFPDDHFKYEDMDWDNALVDIDAFLLLSNQTCIIGYLPECAAITPSTSTSDFNIIDSIDEPMVREHWNQ